MKQKYKVFVMNKESVLLFLLKYAYEMPMNKFHKPTEDEPTGHSIFCLIK
ncbi:MAG: hypothetical protein R2793_06075 [Flavobacteriaceae bacterium]